VSVSVEADEKFTIELSNPPHVFVSGYHPAVHPGAVREPSDFPPTYLNAHHCPMVAAPAMISPTPMMMKRVALSVSIAPNPDTGSQVGHACDDL
jgi:hypothetical protein